ncbi:MAG TPA: Clp protease N-terminal domain-containing protein, partial [Acidimicrobiia bacterium]
MPLDPNRFTRKTTEAIQAASAGARAAGHSEVTADHLLGALLAQPEGVVNGVLERIGVAGAQLRARVDEALAKRPSVSGATV